MSNGVKDTEGKIALNLIPPHALEEVAKVRMFGNKKYGDPWAWLNASVPKEAFIEAAKRHLNQIAKGKLVDPESKLTHLAHAATSLMMALELDVKADAKEKFVSEFKKLAEKKAKEEQSEEELLNGSWGSYGELLWPK